MRQAVLILVALCTAIVYYLGKLECLVTKCDLLP